MTDKNHVTIIAGPTASGKTAHALNIAAETPSVIINADSQQLYKSLPILTAQPTADEQKTCPHFLYGTLGDNDFMSASMWAEAAATHIKQAWNAGLRPIIVGGTGFYLKALMDGFSPIPDVPLSMREQCNADFAAHGAEQFHADLTRDDPIMAGRLHPHDKQRVIRAREVLNFTGTSLSVWQDMPPINILTDAIYEIKITTPPRDILYARCDARIHQMIEMGALGEITNLDARLTNKKAPVTKALGYHELRAHIHGDISLDEAIAATALTTRHYAKRQVTWFKNQIKPQENILNIETIG